MRAGIAAGMVCLAILGFCAVRLAAAAPDRPQPQSGPFATPVTDAGIDDAAAAEWVGGAERPVTNPAALRQVIWTLTSAPPSGAVFAFGDSREPGPRFLRIGFKQPVAVGTVLVRGGDQLSVLRPGAPYPGKLADEAQWIPAQRVLNRQPSTAEVPAGDYALWVLPAGTQTRALRLSHVATATDQSFAGSLGGIYVLGGRYANLAPEASVFTSANSPAAPRLTDLQYNSWWATWDNGPEYPHAVTAATPEWILLAWHNPVELRGLAALWAGFNAAQVQVFTGPAGANPQAAPDSQWQSVGAGFTLRNQYPRQLGVDWMDFGRTVTTRAVRLKMTAVTDESRHPHLVGKTKDGRRVWLGELMAISPLASAELKAVAATNLAAVAPHPPIPIRFTLPAPAYVTLAIDDAKGNRVRNLLSDTLFPAGANTAWWDGTDDLGRTPEAAEHGVYLIPTHFVTPGHYTVRLLTHAAIDLRYEMTVYNAGSPPWITADGTGGWLTNHTPGSATLFVPADRGIEPQNAGGGKPLVYLGSFVSEGGSALAWVDLDGHKQGGRGWIGGAWTGAPYLARDVGPHADPNHAIYVASVWGDKSKPEVPNESVTLRLTALTAHGDRPVLNYAFAEGGKRDAAEDHGGGWFDQVEGLSVRNGVAVVSFSMLNKLAFVDVAGGKVTGFAPVEDPRGSAFDAQGDLLVLSGKRLLRYKAPANGAAFSPQPGEPEVVVAQGLEDPVGLAVDTDGSGDGSIYVSDRGASNQVKVFSAQGKLVRAIGHAGASKAGPYDPLHMNNPRGITIDSNHHLWVAEEDFQPKRISVWSQDGKLIHAFYGPAEYGGGGALDPTDKTKFYYHAMEFKLDWRTGSSAPDAILYRQQKGDPVLPIAGSPNSVLYSNGHRYFTDSYLSHGTNGMSVGLLYLDEGGVLHLVAALGKANDWAVFADPAFKAKLPAGTDQASRAPDKSILFTWSDLNGDGKVEPDEVSFAKAATGWVTIAAEPQAAGPVMLDEYVDGKAMRYAPVRMIGAGIPIYDLHQGTVVAEGAQGAASDGGGQMLTSPQATVLTTAPAPFARQGVGGIDAQGHRWSYPSLWPGLHPSHSAPVADHPGELLGTTRLLGGFIHGPQGVGDLWGINGNFGDMYLFTADGLFITQLFQDVRTGKPWNMPVAQRNMLLNDVTLHDENFFPSLTQTADGNVYVVDGDRTSIVRVDGLNTLKRLPDIGLDLTKSDLTAAQSFEMQSELSRQQNIGPQSLVVTLRSGPPPVLHDLVTTLAAASWATVDRRITKVGWSDKPDVVEAAVTIAGDRLYAAFRTSDPNLLGNSGAVADAPFKTGGALDLMIGTNSGADPQRKAPVEGDLRLLVYQVNGQTHAMLYRPVMHGATHPVPFSSPDRTITIDQVLDVSDRVQLDAANGNYAFSVPLETLGLHPRAGETIKADIGILRGNGMQTTQRVYWSDKATGITSDVPSEAQLTPALWGEWVFEPAQ